MREHSTVLFLTAIDENGETRDFSYRGTSLEDSFDLLSYIAAKGHTLLRASLVDENGLTNLPMEVFDKDPISPIIQELEKDWYQVLNQPTDSVSTPPLKMDHCIIYFSNSVSLFDEKELATILRQSRFNNAKSNITGVLLYVRGSIIQVLEGEQKAVEALYKRVEEDPRHTNVSRVLSRPIQTRLFPDWHMGYETLSVVQLEELKATLGLTAGEEPITELDNHIILRTLKAFYNSNRYN